ncbi:unnamed protein product, partial [marine sediment metagenome]
GLNSPFLRSKGAANAAFIAEYFEGGGHLHASGFTIHGNYENLLKEIPKTVDNLIMVQARKKGPKPK